MVALFGLAGGLNYDEVCDSLVNLLGSIYRKTSFRTGATASALRIWVSTSYSWEIRKNGKIVIVFNSSVDTLSNCFLKSSGSSKCERNRRTKKSRSLGFRLSKDSIN